MRALRLARLQSRSAASLLSNSSVSPAANADILTFSVTDHSPQIAERLAGAYATAYTQYRRKLDTASIVDARSLIQAQLAKLKAAGEQRGAVYANLFEKDQQLRTMQALLGSNALLVRAASGAVQTQPRPTRNGALAAMLGLLLGVGIVFLRDALNTRVRTAGEVLTRLDLPQLGRIPEPPRRLRSGNGIVMLTDPLSPAAEPFRILAANLDFVNLERNARTIMFTSATHGEGKSTTVANLAVALARGGRRVILADLDVRKPSLDDFSSSATAQVSRQSYSATPRWTTFSYRSRCSIPEHPTTDPATAQPGEWPRCSRSGRSRPTQPNSSVRTRSPRSSPSSNNAPILS